MKKRTVVFLLSVGSAVLIAQGQDAAAGPDAGAHARPRDGKSASATAPGDLVQLKARDLDLLRAVGLDPARLKTPHRGGEWRLFRDRTGDVYVHRAHGRRRDVPERLGLNLYRLNRSSPRT